MSDNKQRGQEALDKLDKKLKRRENKKKRGPLLIGGAVAAVVVVAAGGIYIAADQEPDTTTTAEDSTDPQPPEAQALATARAEALPASVTCEYTEDGSPSNGATLPDTEDVSAEGTVGMTLVTNQGEIAMELDRAASPCTVNAITHLAEEDYYDDTICHRLTTGAGLQVLQCGDPTGQGTGGPGFTFANEFPTDEASEEEKMTPVVYERGTLAMANTGQPNSNGSQFFLNYGDSTLPPTYTYFGQITDEGLEVLDEIAAAGVDGAAGSETPAEEVRIKDVIVES